MEPKPVEGSRQPAYPTRREVLAGAASFVLVGLTGSNFIFAETEDGKIAVAPIFEHGEGRGATGCVVISPPVFLSEEEGMQILREELAKHKIELKAGDTLEGVRIPARIEKYEEVEKDNGQMELKRTVVEVPDHAEPLKLSGIDSKRKIAVELVTKKNYSDLGGPDSASTAQGYNFKNIAERVVSLAEKQGKEPIFLGVFYDPLTKPPRPKKPKEGEKDDWETAWKKQEKEGKAESEKLLREQAQDFVAWLKKQKAIE